MDEQFESIKARVRFMKKEEFEKWLNIPETISMLAMAPRDLKDFIEAKIRRMEISPDMTDAEFDKFREENRERAQKAESSSKYTKKQVLEAARAKEKAGKPFYCRFTSSLKGYSVVGTVEGQRIRVGFVNGEFIADNSLQLELLMRDRLWNVSFFAEDPQVRYAGGKLA